MQLLFLQLLHLLFEERVLNEKYTFLCLIQRSNPFDILFALGSKTLGRKQFANEEKLQKTVKSRRSNPGSEIGVEKLVSRYNKSVKTMTIT